MRPVLRRAERGGAGWQVGPLLGFATARVSARIGLGETWRNGRRSSRSGRWRLSSESAGECRNGVAESAVAALRAGAPVVVGNMSARERSSIDRLVENVGAILRYQPPYSPDPSSIELCWSRVKGIIPAAAARFLKSLGSASCTAWRSVFPL